MKHSGWRKPTPELAHAEHLGKVGEQLSVPKGQALLAVKRISSHLKLRGADLHILDLLAAFSANQDWNAGKRPLVWPSNQYLSECTGLSICAIKRHLRKLSQIGLITFKDSPNGQRWGKRDQNGDIVQAFGIDLSPLQAQAEEFTALFEQITLERRLKRDLKRQVTIARRSVRMILETVKAEALSGPWAQLNDAYNALIEQLPSANSACEIYATIAQKFQTLQHQTRKAFEQAMEINQPTPPNNDVCIEKTHPKQCKTDTPILITNNINNSNFDRNNVAPILNTKVDLQPDESNDLDNITPAFIFQSCPQFAQTAQAIGRSEMTWQGLIQASETIRSLISISPMVWNKTCHSLGKPRASVALSLIFEKYCLDKIKNPNAYLQALVDRAQSGTLHLARSLHGLHANNQNLALDNEMGEGVC